MTPEEQEHVATLERGCQSLRAELEAARAELNEMRAGWIPMSLAQKACADMRETTLLKAADIVAGMVVMMEHPDRIRAVAAVADDLRRLARPAPDAKEGT